MYDRWKIKMYDSSHTARSIIEKFDSGEDDSTSQLNDDHISAGSKTRIVIIVECSG